MKRIVLFVLLLLIAGWNGPDAAADGEKSKKKKAKSASSRIDDGSRRIEEARKKKKARTRAGRRGRRAQASTTKEPIQTGTGTATPTDPSAASTPGVEPAVMRSSLQVTGKVLYGDVVQVRKAAVVDVQKVFAAIPAYKKIKTENVPKHKARYHILVNQANQEFQAAVQAVALHDAFDLVAEKGGTRGGAPTDITDQVLARIDGKK